MFKLDNITRRSGELDFLDNIGFVFVFELDDITKGSEELDFFDNVEFV
jgi:hypothetical protein